MRQYNIKIKPNKFERKYNMRIVVINGSPKGKDSNTNKMVAAFLKGAQAAGAEIINIFLAEKDIKHCKGCLICWQRGPCQCVTKDDMLEVISLMGSANLIVFASPVYFGNISGMLKVFMDRMTMIGSPHQSKTTDTDKEKSGVTAVQVPKLIMISSCGYADRSEFEVTSLWINKVAKKMHMELAGEIYAVKAKYLSDPPENLKLEIDKYLHLLENAGKEVVHDMRLSESIKKMLEKANDSFDK